jgi:hypothetical protein
LAAEVEAFKPWRCEAAHDASDVLGARVPERLQDEPGGARRVHRRRHRSVPAAIAARIAGQKRESIFRSVAWEYAACASLASGEALLLTHQEGGKGLRADLRAGAEGCTSDMFKIAFS